MTLQISRPVIVRPIQFHSTYRFNKCHRQGNSEKYFWVHQFENVWHLSSNVGILPPQGTVNTCIMLQIISLVISLIGFI